MHTMKMNLRELIKQLEIVTGHDYQLGEICDGVGITRPTLNNMLSGNVGRATLATVLDVLDFFEAESERWGIDFPVTIDRLITIERVQNDPPNPKHPTTNH